MIPQPTILSFFISLYLFLFFFFNDPPTTEIYTLSLHDALPICCARFVSHSPAGWLAGSGAPESSNNWKFTSADDGRAPPRSEEHTSELQSQSNLVCRLLLEKKKIVKSNELTHIICRSPLERFRQ